MVVYGLVWRGLCVLLGAVGVVLAFVVVPVDLMVTLVVVSVLAGLIVTVASWSEEASLSDVLRRLVLIPLIGSAALAIAGMGAVLGIGVTGVVLIVGLSSPAAISLYRRSLQRAPKTEAPPITISTAELCRQWQDSHEALRRATSADARLRIVQARQRCLDELEKRDPEGLSAWLASTASAAGDPSRFLTGGDQLDQDPAGD